MDSESLGVSCARKMEFNKTNDCSDDDVLLLCYSKLIEANCKTVEKVAVNYVLSSTVEQIDWNCESDRDEKLKFSHRRVNS